MDIIFLEAFENAMQDAIVHIHSKKQIISVKPQCGDDIKKAKAMEKILNHTFSKLVEIPGFKEDFINCTLKQIPFKLDKYLDKI